MGNVYHRNLVGADLHEPKDISTAVIDSVYTADGNGTGAWLVPPSIDPADIAIPVGTIVHFAGTTIPLGWAWCNGQELLRSVQSDLFTAIGTTYGAGNGTTTFNVPNIRGRVIAGKDDMGGTSADRLTGLSGGVDGDNLGATGGLETHTLVASEVPTMTGTSSSNGAHTHTVNNGTSVYRNVSGITAAGAVSNVRAGNITISSAGAHTHTGTVNDTTLGLAHNNVQPTLILHTIIYHGVV